MSGQPPMRERVNIDYDWAFRAGGPSRWYSGTGELKWIGLGQVAALKFKN